MSLVFLNEFIFNSVQYNVLLIDCSDATLGERTSSKSIGKKTQSSSQAGAQVQVTKF